MKTQFTLAFLLLLFAASQAQNLRVNYSFSDYAGDTVYDASGNGYNGVMYGSSKIVSIGGDAGVLETGKTNADYMTIPAASMDGL